MEYTEDVRRDTQEESEKQRFHKGNAATSFRYLGFHRVGGKAFFRVWAPNAERVSVIGDFNGWDRDADPMRRVSEKGIWEAALDGDRVRCGQNYKYRIVNGCRTLEKADPYATRMEMPPKTASVIPEENLYEWRDAGWMQYRRRHYDRKTAPRRPIHIYELHAGSWKRHEDGSPLGYRELAQELAPYALQMGYTHVELLPLAEHPFDGSWGYQVTGYFAPTARYGDAQDLKYLVDTLHEAGIGVIFDWVPAHFPKDAHGLFEFDGQPLYEYQSPVRMEHPLWGTRCFDLGRPEVQSFLLSAASYWVEEFHADGLRFDAVAEMLYLDCDRRQGEWSPNRCGDNRNLEGFAFLRRLNRHFAQRYPDVITVAEESTPTGNLTTFERGGTGFTFKWNMGWMNDSLAYLSTDFAERARSHGRLNFAITYAFGEQYVLPISHDEVTHGKRSLLGRCPGTYEQKFAGCRAYLLHMMTHPGKKLTFMGCEIGQFDEWNHDAEVEWFLTEHRMHAAMQLYCAELNHLYLCRPALWERDGSEEGFAWIDADNAAQNIYSYRRIDGRGRELVILLNLSPVAYESYLLAVPQAGTWEEIFNSDATRYGGTGMCNRQKLYSEEAELSGYSAAVRVRVAPLSGMILQCTRRRPAKDESTN